MLVDILELQNPLGNGGSKFLQTNALTRVIAYFNSYK